MRISNAINLWLQCCWRLLGLAASRDAAAQRRQFLMPEQSAAKAKQLLQAGDRSAWRKHVSECPRRRPAPAGLASSTMRANSPASGTFIDYEQPPVKERQENLPKRNIIEVYNGDKGWDLDRGGVSEAPGRSHRFPKET